MEFAYNPAIELAQLPFDDMYKRVTAMGLRWNRAKVMIDDARQHGFVMPAEITGRRDLTQAYGAWMATLLLKRKIGIKTAGFETYDTTVRRVDGLATFCHGFVTPNVVKVAAVGQGRCKLRAVSCLKCRLSIVRVQGRGSSAFPTTARLSSSFTLSSVPTFKLDWTLRA